MKIEPRYVSFEQAKLLKEKKFVCKVYKEYTPQFDFITDTDRSANCVIGGECSVKYAADDSFAAPEQWQVKEWLRINHSIDLQDICHYGKLGRIYRMGIIFINKKGEVDTVFLRPVDTSFDFIEFESPQEAYSAAFDYVLRNLI